MIDQLKQLSNLIALLALVAAIVAALLAYPAFRQARIGQDIEGFREIRRRLVAQRAVLAQAARDCYPGGYVIPGSGLLTRIEWLLDEPVRLDRVLVCYHRAERTPSVTGHAKEIQRLLPRDCRRRGLRTYSQVLGADDTIRPGLFWNGLSYDLRTFRPTEDGVTLELGPTHYFDMVDVSEAVAHEFAAGRHRERGSLRRRIGDPTDLSRRRIVPALAWLTVLRETDGTLTFLLHARDGTAVASDGDLMQVFGGQLQPSSRHALDGDSEATLWQSFVREFAEELLGVPDADGQGGGAISYTAPPFDELTTLSAAGELDVRLMGLGVDPLSHWPTFLCMAVVDRRLFGGILPEIVDRNTEGTVVGSRREGPTLYGFRFDKDVIEGLCTDPAVGAVTVACLRLAWRNRVWFGIEEHTAS